jgi:putative transposase
MKGIRQKPVVAVVVHSINSGHKQAMPLWKRIYHCPNPDCRLVMDRDENSAVNILKRYLARRGPHTGDPVRCADVFTATEMV